MDRKSYWNKDYYEYWKQRVDEANQDALVSQIVTEDAVTGGDKVLLGFFEQYPFRPGNILEIGCAWGRWFQAYLNYGLQVNGIDISGSMIEAARDMWEGKEGIHQILEAEAEALPFENKTFDNVACLAVFDATYQDQALKEMFRVAKPGGLIYLTGKNDHYYPDDQLALDAEIGAREKKHPNYFTDVKAMLRQISDCSHKVLATKFFPRRGDFAKSSCVHAAPELYYEYFVVLQKNSDRYDFISFSEPYSKTFKALQP